MQFNHPLTEEPMPLFKDADKDVSMFRVVVKANLSKQLATDLLDAVMDTVKFLERAGASYAEMHAGAKANPFSSH